MTDSELNSSSKKRAWIEINRNSLQHNYNTISSLLPSTCQLIPVVKANAYGHGALPVSRILESIGAKFFAVATVREAIELRANGVTGEILILGAIDPEDAEKIQTLNLIATVVSFEHAKMLSKQGFDIRVHIAIDTGMRRLGIPSENSSELFSACRLNHLKVEGIFTHLCVSGSTDPAHLSFTQEQKKRFLSAAKALKEKTSLSLKMHIQASSGIVNLTAPEMDFARAGIILYGLKSENDEFFRKELSLRPVLSLKARVISVRKLAYGEGIGYGLSFVANKDKTVATVSIGYADGYPRSLSGKGEVLICGKRAPILGRVCMDLIMVDVSHIDTVQFGDVVTLIGKDGSEEITAYEIADKTDSITHEVLSRLGSRLCRILTD